MKNLRYPRRSPLWNERPAKLITCGLSVALIAALIQFFRVLLK